MAIRFLSVVRALGGAVAVASLLVVNTAAQSPAGAAKGSAQSTAKTASSPKSAWTPPRTPWGDPDIEGMWPGTDFVGVPLQRPRNLGTRNELTDGEFAARLEAFQRQADEDNADFHIDQLTPELV